MALSYLVDAAKRNTPYVRPVDPNSPLKKLINLPNQEETSSSLKEEQSKSFSNQKVNWEICKFRKTVGNRDMCGQFLTVCRKDKCNNKFIVPKEPKALSEDSQETVLE